MIVATLWIVLSLLVSVFHPFVHRSLSFFSSSSATPHVSFASSRGLTIPPGGTLFHSHPDVKWVVAGSMGAQRRARWDAAEPWELSVAFSTGVAWVVEIGRENRNGRGRRSSPLCIPHLVPRRTGANVKRFRDLRPTLASRTSARRHQTVTPGTHV